jgi:hypothetical protein
MNVRKLINRTAMMQMVGRAVLYAPFCSQSRRRGMVERALPRAPIWAQGPCNCAFKIAEEQLCITKCETR